MQVWQCNSLEICSKSENCCSHRESGFALTGEVGRWGGEEVRRGGGEEVGR